MHGLKGIDKFVRRCRVVKRKVRGCDLHDLVITYAFSHLHTSPPLPVPHHPCRQHRLPLAQQSCRAVVLGQDILVVDNTPEAWEAADQGHVWAVPDFGNRLNSTITDDHERATAMRLVRSRQGLRDERDNGLRLTSGAGSDVAVWVEAGLQPQLAGHDDGGGRHDRPPVAGGVGE